MIGSQKDLNKSQDIKSKVEGRKSEKRELVKQAKCSKKEKGATKRG